MLCGKTSTKTLPTVEPRSREPDNGDYVIDVDLNFSDKQPLSRDAKSVLTIKDQQRYMNVVPKIGGEHANGIGNHRASEKVNLVYPKSY